MHDIRSTYLEGFQGTIIVLDLESARLLDRPDFSATMGYCAQS